MKEPNHYKEIVDDLAALNDQALEGANNLYDTKEINPQAVSALIRRAHEISTNPVRHFIVSGRIPFDDEDVYDVIACGPDEDPWCKFVEEVLYESQDLPENWQETDGTPACPVSGQSWALQGMLYEIFGPPL